MKLFTLETIHEGQVLPRAWIACGKSIILTNDDYWSYYLAIEFPIRRPKKYTDPRLFESVVGICRPKILLRFRKNVKKQVFLSRYFAWVPVE